VLVASGRRAASHLSCDLEHSRKRDRRSADGTRIEALRAPRHGCEKGLEVWSRKGGLCTLPKMLNANSMFFCAILQDSVGFHSALQGDIKKRGN